MAQQRQVQDKPKFIQGGIVFGVVAMLVVSAESAMAQTAAAKEFMEASSPLKKGGVVVTRTAPGQQVETVIYREAPSLVGTGSLAGSGEVTITPPPDTYPYPQAIPSLNNGVVLGVVQVPSLGYSGTTAQRPGWWGQPTQRPGWFSSPSSATNYSVGVPPPVASTAPAIQYPQAYPSGQTVTAASPQWTQPFAAPPPQPMVRFQNMPPGSYMGQGIVGQPKAFVDGQPVRNLFRYLTPF
jgi:hypothetical protein